MKRVRQENSCLVSLPSPAKLVDGAYKRSNLGIVLSNPECEMLPKNIDLDAYCEHWYGNVTPEPRPVLYLPLAAGKDSLEDDDIIIRPEENSDTITPQQILAKAASTVTEANGIIEIDAASAMAQTAFASTNDSADGTSWNYCDSPAYNEVVLLCISKRKAYHGVNKKRQAFTI